MIDAIELNLKRGINLLETISDDQYSDCSVPPYYSSIGNNMRHILDIFSCIFKGIEVGVIDFSNRERNELAQQKTASGIEYFNNTLKELETLKNTDLDVLIKVSDDLGNGKVITNYTLGAALVQAHSHAIHHYSSIGFIMSHLGIELIDSAFGYNPTTPKLKAKLSTNVNPAS